MNRRDRQRMDDRRRQSIAPKQNYYDLSSSGSSKTLMDNYLQSQKVIQSLSETPGGVIDVKSTKPFRIPKKQPVNIAAESSIRGRNARDQSKNSPSESGSNSRQRGRGDDFNVSRKNLHDDRAEQNRRFDAERRQGDQVRSKRDFYGSRTEPKRMLADEVRRTDERPKRDSYDGRTEPKRIVADDVQRTDDFPDSKRTRLDLPSRRDRLRQRTTEPSSTIGYTALEKLRLKNRLYFNQPIDIIISDRSAPSGKISAENAAIFLNEIQESVAQRILTDPKYQTKFTGQRHEKGLITLTCADDFTTVFIQQKLTEELSLWPGAKLEWSFGDFRSCFINLVIPNDIPHLSEFLDICKKTDSRMLTEKWRRIECCDTDDDSGKFFKLAIDKQSYELIKQQGSIVRCGDLSIKIRCDPLNEISEELRQSNLKRN